MKLSKFKLLGNYTELEKSKLKNIISGSIPDCETVVTKIVNGVEVMVCYEFQPGDCFSPAPH